MFVAAIIIKTFLLKCMFEMGIKLAYRVDNALLLALSSDNLRLT